MTATGALIARHVTDLFPTQTSRFDLAQAARRGVIAPLRCIRIPPGPGRAHDRQGAAAPRRGRHRVRPGDAGRAARPDAVQHGDRRPLQDALQRRARRRLRRRRAPRLQRRQGVPRRGHEGQGGLRRDAQARAGARSWPTTSRGKIDVLVNAQLLAEGWNSPRATVCMHLAPTASKRIYQQRVGPRHPPPSGQGGRDRHRLRPSGDQARRPGRHAALAARPRRLPRRRDRRRPGAPRPRPPRAGRAPRAAGHARSRAARRGLRARAVADRGRAPRLRRAARLGGAGRRARRAQRLAPRQGDAPLRPRRRAQAPLPAHRGPAQPQRPAAPARAAGDRRRAATPRRSTPRSTSWPAGRATSAARA